MHRQVIQRAHLWKWRLPSDEKASTSSAVAVAGFHEDVDNAWDPVFLSDSDLRGAKV